MKFYASEIGWDKGGIEFFNDVFFQSLETRMEDHNNNIISLFMTARRPWRSHVLSPPSFQWQSSDISVFLRNHSSGGLPSLHVSLCHYIHSVMNAGCLDLRNRNGGLKSWGKSYHPPSMMFTRIVDKGFTYSLTIIVLSSHNLSIVYIIIS